MVIDDIVLLDFQEFNFDNLIKIEVIFWQINLEKVIFYDYQEYMIDQKIQVVNIPKH